MASKLVVIPEDKIRAEVGKLITQKHWKKMCLLILTLAPKGKLVSRNFIYDKLVEWGFWNYNAREKLAHLNLISKTLCQINFDELTKREDLSRLSQKKFEKFCEQRIAGGISKIGNHRTQSVFRLSTKGKKEARL